ncbi:MAG: PAS domain-containing protein [Desulfohalobiaceae bacterium]
MSTEKDADREKQILEQLRESQRALSTLLSNLPGMAYRCQNNYNWTMEFVSEGSIELTGYQPNDLMNDEKMAFGELIEPNDRLEGWKKVQESLKHKIPFQRTYRITTAVNEEKWVWEQGRGVYSNVGELVALEGFITDITKYKHAEQELKRHRDHLEELVKERTAELSEANENLKREIEEHQRTEEALKEEHATTKNILAASPIGISLLENLKFSWVNTHMCNIFNFTQESDYKDKNIECIFAFEEDFNRLLDSTRDCSQKDTSFKMDVQLKRKDGSLFDGHLSMSFWHSSSSYNRAIITISDISLRKKMERERIAKEKMEGVLEMAGAVCHEMNQPLQGLFFSLNEVMDGSSNLDQELENMKQFIEKIRDINLKMMNITRYQTRDYINGVRIIDIHGASNSDGED